MDRRVASENLFSGKAGAQEYVGLVLRFQELGYETKLFHDFFPEQQHLILRHDVDLSLEAAAVMADLEAKHGWTATYFVLLCSEFYNVFSAAGRRSLCSIVERGHDVGLHVDPS
ncbi:hypothetical protein, partial [Bradyrhizobium ottawaense]|uniref:hypothetical protein n=1 Tax=Bradyrhizobium ottawaense TaxID=931866 RepID=UPI0030C72C63